MRIVAFGTSVTVWRAASGGVMQQVLNTTGASNTLSTVRTRFVSAASSAFQYDDIRVLADGWSDTYTYAYNTANGFFLFGGKRKNQRKSGLWRGASRSRRACRFQQSDLTPFRFLFAYFLFLQRESRGGDGKRRSSAVSGGATTRYYWDRGYTVLNESNGSGTLQRTYVGRNMAHVDGTSPSTGAYNYYLTDHLGSTRLLYDQSKARVGEYDFAPYGEDLASGTSLASPATHLYTGHDWDATSALYFAPYRYYNPTVSRWLTRDPLGMIDGPNKYWYVKGRPVRLWDRLGAYSVSGDCCGKEDEIKKQVDEACKNLDKWVSDPKLQKCVQKRCDSGKIKCRTGGKDCEDSYGWAWKGIGKTANICMNAPEADTQFDDTAIHEWLHTCGYHKQDDGDNVPWGDGK